MKQKQAPKPRNPFVQHLVKRKSGAHQKPYKTVRRDAKVEMKKTTPKNTTMFLRVVFGSVAELV